MRIVSFLPSATSLLLALGAGGDLVGISHESRRMPQVAHLPVVSDLVFEDRDLTAKEIDAAVSTLYRRGRSLYRVDQELLRSLQPDLLIAQEICEICAVTPNDFQKMLTRLRPMPEVLSLNAHTLEEAAEDIRRIGLAAGRTPSAETLLGDWARRRQAVRERLDGVGSRPCVACLEWPEPLLACGHWVPEMVALAGGTDGLGAVGGRSRRLDWNALRAYDPEVIVMMFCGMPLDESMQEARRLLANPDFSGLRAVRNGHAWVSDGPQFFSQSGPRLIQGVEILAKLIHPDRFGPADPAEALPFPPLGKSHGAN